MTTSSTSFTSVSSGTPLLALHGQEIAYSLSGTFSATMQLVKSVDGGKSFELLTQKTAASTGSVIITNRAVNESALVMWRCIAYTSGTAVTSISSGTERPTVDVSDFCTSGNGTSLAPYVGWDTAITWQPDVNYNFPPGFYSYATAPSNWDQDHMRLIGTPSTVLRCTGAGPVMKFDGGSSVGANFRIDVFAGPFILEGNGTTTLIGLYNRGVTRSYFDRIRVRGVTDYGIKQNFGVLNEYIRPRISEIDTADGTYVMPAVHFCISARSEAVSADFSSTTHLIQPLIEHNFTGTGLQLLYGTSDTKIDGGTVEGFQLGVDIGSDNAADVTKTTFNNVDLEFNVKDVKITRATGTTFINTGSISTPIQITVTGVTGTFAIGEGITYTQAGNTATAELQQKSGSTYKLNLYVKTGGNGLADGATSGTITGASSGATATVATCTYQDAYELASGAKLTTWTGGHTDWLINDTGMLSTWKHHAFHALYFKKSGSYTEWDRCYDYGSSKLLSWEQPRWQTVASASVTNGGTTTVNEGIDLLVLDNAGGIAGHTVNLPQFTNCYSGVITKTRIRISASSTITSLTLTDSPAGRTVAFSPIANFRSCELYYDGDLGYKWIQIA